MDWNSMTDKEKEQYYNSCPKCGGEKDGEGWCANYCMEGENGDDNKTAAPIAEPRRATE